jgi:hypothetical protein
MAGSHPLQAGESWMKEARVAGVLFSELTPDYRIQSKLDVLVKEGVTVLQGCSALSYYTSDADFDRQMQFVTRITSYAHQRGLKVFWYFPTLESITPDGRLMKKGTMLRDHPEWLQRPFDRRKGLKKKTENEDGDSIVREFNDELLSYYYGTRRTHVEANDEDVWVCPNSPFRGYFLNRVEKLAATGIDGIWYDGPRFNTFYGLWNCACTHCQAKFRQDTGLGFPGETNFRRPLFRKWVEWRHKTLADFLNEAALRARAVRPEIRTMVEVVGCDNLGATREGLDAAWFGPNIDVAWKIEPISDTTGMRDAYTPDWLSMMVTYKFCGGAGPGEDTFAYSSGVQSDDGQLVMAIALAAQCRPYETRVPRIAASVGRNFRTEMFQWISLYSKELFDAMSQAPVALLYSPENRDYIDGTEDGGFYRTATPPTPAIKWWVRNRRMVLQDCTYLDEYKGWGMFLIRNHIPFDVITLKDLSKDGLARYRALILPNAVCISRETKDMLQAYASGGGHLVVTGGEAGRLDMTGALHPTSLWSMGGDHERATMLIDRCLPGKAFSAGKDGPGGEKALAFLKKAGVAPLISGSAPLYIEQYGMANMIILHVINYGWVGQKKLEVSNTAAAVTLPLAQGQAVKSVSISSPGEKGSWRGIPFTASQDAITFNVDVSINQLVKVEL